MSPKLPILFRLGCKTLIQSVKDQSSISYHLMNTKALPTIETTNLNKKERKKD